MATDRRKRTTPSPHEQRINHLQNALRETVERYDLVFQATHDILYDLNLLTGKVLWNNELSQQFGYTQGEAADTLEWWTSHIHPDDALEVERELSEWFASDSNNWQLEYRFKKANGTYRYVLDRGFVIRAADRTPVRIIGTLFDITEQRELDRAKDEFISLVSHQLRTPLTVIRVYGEMFADGLLGSLSATQSEHIGRMTDASIRLIKLVNDILDVSRIEMGNYLIDRQTADLNQVIQACIDAIIPFAKGKGVHITFMPDESCQNVAIDKVMVSQIIDNLLVNAVRYTRPDHGLIKVWCHRDQNDVVLRIHDNGIGIPKAAQKRVFDRFYRAHNAINIEEHGSGLGLYLVKMLVTILEGEIWFESSASAGTTFYVTLPAA